MCNFQPIASVGMVVVLSTPTVHGGCRLPAWQKPKRNGTTAVWHKILNQLFRC